MQIKCINFSGCCSFNRCRFGDFALLLAARIFQFHKPSSTCISTHWRRRNLVTDFTLNQRQILIGCICWQSQRGRFLIWINNIDRFTSPQNGMNMQVQSNFLDVSTNFLDKNWHQAKILHTKEKKIDLSMSTVCISLFSPGSLLTYCLRYDDEYEVLIFWKCAKIKLTPDEKTKAFHFYDSWNVIAFVYQIIMTIVIVLCS